jgi:hypothetical protein
VHRFSKSALPCRRQLRTPGAFGPNCRLNEDFNLRQIRTVVK